MSGLEVLGAVSAASALLESAIAIIRRIRRAQAQQKDLVKTLACHGDEVENTKAILALVEDEEALRTAKVVSEVSRMKSVAEELVTFLTSIDPGSKNTARQVAHQLIHGSKDEETLINIMQKLNHAKSDLSLRIQVALVGVAKTVENKLIANTEVVKRIDEIVKEVFGDGRGLKLAELIENKPAQDDGIVVLSDDDVKELGAEVTDENTAVVIPTSRIVAENTSEEQALQINGPIGKEGWWEVSNLEIRNNKALSKAIQVNHGISVDTFDRLLAHRSANIDR
ncbi:hypothetical protein BS50DRAFT_580568 [Corynespora cassiicola Philippines]|uniref:Fungal N-terminal domain-containing protein n=1 Tax=Corynespora cassiicola Philippines TaxID=1448308 RepID=A0A2T2MZM6_CORCC|nr:hypothetical protein BS50DRAFT_580567 [Corynespora cassiicola Philippines]PSN58671.1 hypothetical protein BS50DRAFT_580568 [Corynespora cassiicola Philippines]